MNITQSFSFVIFIWTLIIFLYSCSNTTLIQGKYSAKHSPYLIVFSEDSIFKYESRKGCYTESSGTWKKIGNTIYLNSIEQIDKMPIEYTKTENNKGITTINIIVNALDKKEKDYICFPYVNGKRVNMEPEKGSYSFESKGPIDSIYFLIAKKPFVLRGTGTYGCYDDVYTESILLHSSGNDLVNITINIIDSLFGYKVFKEERLGVKNGKIIFKDEGKNYKLYLKK